MSESERQKPFDDDGNAFPLCGEWIQCRADQPFWMY